MSRHLFILIFTFAFWLGGCESSQIDNTDGQDSNPGIFEPSGIVEERIDEGLDENISPPVYPGPGGDLARRTRPELMFTIDLNSRRQTIDGFGASDAWSIQYVGNWQSAPDIAELLFSTELDTEHNPKGIGLSVWRFNIGAGSAEQDNIRDPWRRTESFLQADGGYDWSKQQGQQEFLQLAKYHGLKRFIAFANSPPIYLTSNGNTFGDGGNSSNLPLNQVDRFAQFLVDVWSYFANPEGPDIDFDYISPVNEPQWDWAQINGQEGSPYTNSEIASLVKSLDNIISTRGIDTKIELPEAAQLDFLYQDLGQRGNQLEALFSPESSDQVGHLDHVAYKLAGHSYFTTWPVSSLIETRQQLAQRLRAYPGLTFWMSEYCVYENNPEVKGHLDVKGIEPALYTARVIHHDLTIANASSWQWWLAVSPYNYNDGLIYVSKNKNQGYQESKTLWALGQFSRFIRPGMMRVEVLRNDQLSLAAQAESIMASAYHDDNTGRIVVVLVNYASEDKTIGTELREGNNSVSQWIPYVTSATDNMKAYAAIKGTSAIAIPARSIVTLVANQTEAVD